MANDANCPVVKTGAGMVTLKEARGEGWYALGGVLFGAVLAFACLLAITATAALPL